MGGGGGRGELRVREAEGAASRARAIVNEYLMYQKKIFTDQIRK